MAAPSAPAVAASPGEEHLAGTGSATVITIPAKIVSVNRGKKLLALEGSRGKQVHYVYNSYNLAEATVRRRVLQGRNHYEEGGN